MKNEVEDRSFEHENHPFLEKIGKAFPIYKKSNHTYYQYCEDENFTILWWPSHGEFEIMDNTHQVTNAVIADKNELIRHILEHASVTTIMRLTAILEEEKNAEKKGSL